MSKTHIATVFEEKGVLEFTDILEILPHRYPFIFIDRVVAFEDNQRVVCIKGVTANEPYFTGHFPGRPVMPGVIMLEALAQAACILAQLSEDGVAPGKTVVLVGATDIKWKKMVTPGDQLTIEVRSVRKRRPLWVVEGEIMVGDKLACAAKISAMEVD